MKKGILTFSLLTMGICWGQRNMDLTTTISSPVDNEEILVNQATNFSIEVMNHGSEDLLTADSLYIYVTIDGTELVFQPGNSDHSTRTGVSIAANGTYNFAFPLMFMAGFEGSHDICFNILPVNAVNAITETAPADNNDCVTIVVVANNAGLEAAAINSGMIYPNPAKESFCMDTTPDNGKVEIAATDGKKVAELLITNGTFDTSHLPDGTYFVNYSIHSEMKTVRLIVAH